MFKYFYTDKYKLYLIFSIVFSFIIRIKYLSMPLERDEGEYAYFGQQILNGIAPYIETVNMKWPGTYYAYAMIMKFFGQTPIAIHIGLLIINYCSAFLLYKIGMYLFNKTTTIIAVTVFIYLSISDSLLGFAAHATHFVSFFVLLGMFTVLHPKSFKFKFFLSGLCFGAAATMKQNGILFFPMPLIIAIFYQYKNNLNILTKLKNASLALMGELFILITLILTVYSDKSFSNFYFYTIKYAMAYKSKASFFTALTFMLDLNCMSELNLWLMSLVGLFTIFVNTQIKPNIKFIFFTFFTFSFFSICPGSFFRPHYFILLLPAVSLAIGLFLKYIEDNFTKYKFITHLLLITAFIQSFFMQSQYILFESPLDVSNRIYRTNNFTSSSEVAILISKMTAVNDKVLQFGNEPQIYFYSKRKSAVKFLYLYPLFENQPYADEMTTDYINEVEKNKPKLIIIPDDLKLMNPSIKPKLFNWMKDYLSKNYSTLNESTRSFKIYKAN